MNPPASIRLSQQAKDQLTRLKVVTGIDQWNILCRCAFILSVSEKSHPTSQPIPADSNVEMSWGVFAGISGESLWALLEYSSKGNRSQGDADLVHLLRLHIHRGIGHLASVQIKHVRKLTQLLLPSALL